MLWYVYSPGLPYSSLWFELRRSSHFFPLSPPNVFLVGFCQRLSAEQHPETSSYYQQRRNLSHSPPVNDKLPFSCLFPSLCHLPLLFAQGICWGESLLRQSALLTFCFAGANSLSLLAAEAKQCFYNKVPNALPQGHWQVFFICCLSCTPPWHHKWWALPPRWGSSASYQKWSQGQAPGRIHAKSKAALLQSVTRDPLKLFTQSPRKHSLLHAYVVSVFMLQGMGRASFRGEEQGSVWSSQC